MAELERDLRALASYVELPAERDLAPAVRARLVRRSRRSRLRLILIATAALLAAVGIAFAVPPARAAILRFLGFEDVTLVRVDELPPVGTAPIATGTRVSLTQARRLLAFEPLLPHLDGPTAIYVDEGNQILVAVYGDRSARLRLSELIGAQGVYEKMVTLEQHVERLSVNGHPGVWIEGQHVVSELFGQPRISGNALLWAQGGLTLRLEGHLSKAAALRIASSLRRP